MWNLAPWAKNLRQQNLKIEFKPGYKQNFRQIKMNIYNVFNLALLFAL